MIMRSIGYVYVAMKQRSFITYICDSLGVVQDCYILRICNMGQNLSCFQRGPPDDIVNESDEESGFDGSAENVRNGPHWFITEYGFSLLW